MANNAGDGKYKSSFSQVAVSLLGAAVLLVAFDTWINDFIAMPLRVVSTSISEVIVAICGYDVIREGTSLVVGTFRFNVDTACSGSQTMQQMLATAIMLVGVWGGMALGQKVVAVLLALPIAVFVNGLRVTALMLASLQAGKGLPEETFAHQFIGVVAFALALFVFWKVCKVIVKISCLDKGEALLRIVISLTLITVVFFPFFYETVLGWVGSEWNPYNRFAWVFPLVALLLFILTFYLKQSSTSCSRVIKKVDVIVGGGLFTCGLFWAVVVTKLGFVSIQGLGFIAVIIGAIGLWLGMRRVLLEIPVILIMILGFPRMPLVLNELLGRQGEYDWMLLFGVRIVALIILAGVYLFIKAKFAGKSSAESKMVTSTHPNRMWTLVIALLLVSTGGSLLWQGKIDDNADQRVAQDDIALFANIPLNIGFWKGEEYPLSPVTQELLGGTDATLKVYHSDYALPIEFFYNFSGGNRHNLHPPEYCLTGAGWKIISKKSLILVVQNDRKFPITVMKLKNGSDIRWFAFWFYDGVSIKANYLRMLGEDLFSRLGGDKREWSIYRVIAYREEDLMRFVDEISASIK